MSVVEVVVDGEVCRLTLNRPDKLNALNDAVRVGLQEAVDDVMERTDVRVVVMAGAGRAFSAGADLRGPLPRVASNPMAQRRANGTWQRLLNDIERLPQVTIAQLHSHVIGGALLLAAACDFRVGADDTSVWIPELALGIPLTWAGIPRLAREIGLPRTRELVMTGRKVAADEAREWGFLHRVVAIDELDRAVDALVAELLAQPAHALGLTVDLMRALGRAVSAPELGWADPDLLRWSLRDGQPRRD
jgi:enoyl-CoA hydratase/carnithine racemase